MNKFVLHGNKGGMTMGYYTTEDLPLYSIAQDYTLCDNFFHSGFGSSYLNHVFLIAARPPRWKDAPSSMRAKMDSTGKMTKDGHITPDGYVLNTVYSKGSVFPSGTDSSRLMPNQTFPTIGDRLNKKKYPGHGIHKDGIRPLPANPLFLPIIMNLLCYSPITLRGLRVEKNI